MRLTKGFYSSDLREGQKIIVYGAGRYGEIALKGLEAEGLSVDFFADRAYAGGDYLGVPVIAPEELVNHLDDVILIASYNYFYDMLAFLQNLNAEYIYDIEAQLMEDINEADLTEYALDEKKNYQKYLNTINHCDGKELILGHCEVVVTEKCTLKCRDCANLMQYYNNPSTLDMEQIIRSFQVFLDTIDILLEMRILGGEPFICQDLDRLLNAFVKNDKIKRIAIYTNSTIVPKQAVIDSLRNKKISVHMSDYGKYSRNLGTLDKVLSENDIEHYIHPYEDWYDMGDLSKRNYSEEMLEKIFSGCYMARCYTFYRGRFYLCPRAAHGEQLGIFTNGADEVVYFDEPAIDMKQKREELKKVLNQKYITACDYCSGSNVKSKVVQAAVQMER